MAKAIKLRNGYYWDSSSVSHDREELDKVINTNVGKSIRLKKTSNQNFSANNAFDVSWQEILFDNTGGILAKNGNEIKCISGSHTVLVSVFMQLLNGSTRDNYVYIRHNGLPYATTNLNNGNPHLTVPIQLDEGDRILIQAYSTTAGAIGSSYDWTGFIVTLLN